jgi:hypothetical protein
MAMAIKRTAAAGGADAQQTTAAGMWTQITATMVAGGWTEHYSFGAADKVYTSTGESGTERLYTRLIQSGNQLDTIIYQHFQATDSQTGVGVDGSTVSLWEMEEAAGTSVADTTGNFNLTTVNAPAVATPGYIGTHGRTFVRTSSQNMTATGNSTWRNLFQTGNFTIEGWAKPAAINTQNGLVGCNASGVKSVGHLHQNNAGQLVFEYRNAADSAAVTLSGGAGATFTAGTWSHFAVTRTRIGANNNTFKIYFNGVLVITFNGQVDPIAPSTQDVWVGRTTDTLGANAGNNNSYDGVLDHIRVSNVARTDAEILSAFWLGQGAAGTGYNPVGNTAAVGRYTFTAGQNIDYIIIADKDSVTWSSRNVTTGVLWTGTFGKLDLHPSTKPTLIADTGTYNPGSNVVVNLTTNPIAAGYEVGDVITVVSQQTFGSSEPGIIPVFMTWIRALTTTSMTLDTVREVFKTGARIGEDPQPQFMLDGVVGSNPVVTRSFKVIYEHLPGYRNMYRDAFTSAILAQAGKTLLARSPMQENFAEGDPNNRTGRQTVDRLHVYGTDTGSSDTTPIEDALRGWIPRLRYCTDQTKAQWAIGRDIKLTEHATLCDYAVTFLASGTVRYMVGPFTQAGAAGFNVQPTNVDLNEYVIQGAVLPDSEMFADPWDCDPMPSPGFSQFMAPVGELIEIDDWLVLEGSPVQTRDSGQPVDLGTGPYLLGDGDRTGGAGGSNFNNGFN